jgi:hypothetical protein
LDATWKPNTSTSPGPSNIDNVLNFIQGIYPLADLATSNDLEFIVEYLKSNPTNNHFNNQGSYYQNGMYAIYDGEPLCQDKTAGSCILDGWPGYNQNCWIRIPTMDSWSVVSANITNNSNYNNFTLNGTAVFLIL